MTTDTESTVANPHPADGSFKKTSVVVVDGNRNPLATVDAYVIGNIAVHRDADKDAEPDLLKRHWVLTFVPTGERIPYRHRTLGSARYWARKYAKAGWGIKDASLLLTNPEVRKVYEYSKSVQRYGVLLEGADIAIAKVEGP